MPQNNMARKNRFLGDDFLPLQNAQAATLTSLKNTRASLSAAAPEPGRFRHFCETAWMFSKRVTLTLVYTVLFYGLQIVFEDIVVQAFQQSHLMIQNIDLQNNLLVSKEEVLQAIKVRSDANWLTCDLEKIREAVETLPNVKTAVVQKFFPGLLRICLQERMPVFCMSVGGELLDAEGHAVLVKNGFQVYSNLPRLSGIALADNGMVLPDAKPMHQTNVMLLNAFQKCFGRNLGTVAEVSALPSGTELRLQSGLTLRFPEDQPMGLFPRLSRVWEDLRKKGKMAKTIDLQFRDVFVTVG